MELLTPTVTLRASGPVGAREAWDRYRRPARWAGWAPQIRRVECSSPVLAPGATGRVHGPLGVSVDFTIDTVDESQRRWSWTVRRGPLVLHLEHGVDPQPGRTSTWLRVRGPLPVVLAYAPAAQFAIHRLVTLGDVAEA